MGKSKGGAGGGGGGGGGGKGGGTGAGGAGSKGGADAVRNPIYIFLCVYASVCVFVCVRVSELWFKSQICPIINRSVHNQQREREGCDGRVQNDPSILSVFPGKFTTQPYHLHIHAQPSPAAIRAGHPLFRFTRKSEEHTYTTRTRHGRKSLTSLIECFISVTRWIIYARPFRSARGGYVRVYITLV